MIVDIGMRMLTQREPYRAQGLPDNYIIDTGHYGRKFRNKTQVMMIGNSVSPWLGQLHRQAKGESDQRAKQLMR